MPPFVERDSNHEQKAALFIGDLFNPVLQPKKAPVDRHHLFPRKHLDGLGVNVPRDINQIANMSYVEWPENIAISDTPPSTYWPRYAAQFSVEDRFHHALPDGWDRMEYDQFLKERRALMAQVIRRGFETIGAGPVGVEPVESPVGVPDAPEDTHGRLDGLAQTP